MIVNRCQLLTIHHLLYPVQAFLIRVTVAYEFGDGLDEAVHRELMGFQCGLESGFFEGCAGHRSDGGQTYSFQQFPRILTDGRKEIGGRG